MMTRETEGLRGKEIPAKQAAPAASVALPGNAQAGEFSWFDIEADPEAWTALVTKVGGNVFSCAGFLALEGGRRSKRRGVVLYGEGGPRSALGGLEEPAGQGYLFRTPSFWDNSDAHVFQGLLRWLSRHRFNSVELGSYDGGCEGQELSGFKGELVPRYEFLWDLRTSPDEWSQGLHKLHKRRLKKLNKRALSVRVIDTNVEHRLTELRRHWLEKKSKVVDLQWLLRAYWYHFRMRRHLLRPGLATVYGLVDEQEQLLTAAVMLEHAGRAFYMMGASTPEGYKLSASVQLFWELAARYRSAGFTLLNLGGVPRAAEQEGHVEHGVYRFKCGFGLEPMARTSLKFDTEAY